MPTIGQKGKAMWEAQNPGQSYDQRGWQSSLSATKKAAMDAKGSLQKFTEMASTLERVLAREEGAEESMKVRNAAMQMNRAMGYIDDAIRELNKI